MEMDRYGIKILEFSDVGWNMLYWFFLCVICFVEVLGYKGFVWGF